jgi:hypothetical protein
MGKSVDSVHEAVDRADLVHHGLAAIATSPSSSGLGLWLLRWSRSPDEGRRRKREAWGSQFRAHWGSEGSGATTVKAAAVGVPVRGSLEQREGRRRE